MVTNLQRLRAAIAGCTALVASGFALPAAADTPQVTRLGYDAYFGGLQIARTTVSMLEEEGRYTIGMVIEPMGLLKSMYDFRAILESRGRIEGGKPVPDLFVRDWRSKNNQGRMIGREGGSGKPMVATENGEKMEAVPAPLRTAVMDPLSALIGLRNAVLAGVKEKLSFPLFDGKRRFDLLGVASEAEQREILRQPFTLVTARMEIEPRAGFKLRQIEGWKTSKLTMRFDPVGLPRQVMLDGDTYGALVMNLTDHCRGTPTDCPGDVVTVLPTLEAKQADDAKPAEEKAPQ